MCRSRYRSDHTGSCPPQTSWSRCSDDRTRLRRLSTRYRQLPCMSGCTPRRRADGWCRCPELPIPLQVAQMLKVAPLIARFASVTNYNRPDCVCRGRNAGWPAARASLPRISTITARAVARQSISPFRFDGRKPQQAVRQMSYYEPLFKGLNIEVVGPESQRKSARDCERLRA